MNGSRQRDIYWGYGQMDLLWSLLLLLRPWIGYDYTVIHVVCWVELLEQMRLCLIFVKIWIPINGTHNVVSGHPKSKGISRVNGLSTRPPGLGCHN